MIDALRAEFRKILSVRSTYAILVTILALPVSLMGFWVYGYKDIAHAAVQSNALQSALFNGINFTAIFLSFVAILLVGHEYRYNTILYTLTSTKRRSKVFAAKWLAVVLFGLLVAVVAVGLNVLAFYIGQQVHHVATTQQSIPIWDFAWRAGATTIVYISYGFIIAILLRSLVASMAVFLLLPSTIEGLLSLILKDNVRYLPFTSISNLTVEASKIAYTNSLLVGLAYVVGFGALAWYLFTRRDAN
ncbi:hypothetical protein BH09PAT3_BH09PAT3_6480 [soil metagenome]